MESQFLNLLYGFASSAVVGITYVAYKHPIAFKRHWYQPLQSVFTAATIFILLWAVGNLYTSMVSADQRIDWLQSTWDLKLDPSDSLKRLKDQTSGAISNFHWYLLYAAMAFAADCYVYFLSHLPKLINEADPEGN